MDMEMYTKDLMDIRRSDCMCLSCLLIHNVTRTNDNDSNCRTKSLYENIFCWYILIWILQNKAHFQTFKVMLKKTVWSFRELYGICDNLYWNSRSSPCSVSLSSATPTAGKVLFNLSYNIFLFSYISALILIWLSPYYIV